MNSKRLLLVLASIGVSTLLMGAAGPGCGDDAEENQCASYGEISNFQQCYEVCRECGGGDEECLSGCESHF